MRSTMLSCLCFVLFWGHASSFFAAPMSKTAKPLIINLHGRYSKQSILEKLLPRRRICDHVMASTKASDRRTVVDELKSNTPTPRIRFALLVALALSMKTSSAFALEKASATCSATAVQTTKALANPISVAMELRLCIRLLWASVLGGVIGKERSHRYSHAVKTMALVSLGSAIFTLNSIFGFLGTNYDASRMASNVVSGIGFIGAGVIFKDNGPRAEPSPSSNAVHGLTTSAAIFLSAAVGVACGTGLWLIASAATFCTWAILQIGGNMKHSHHLFSRESTNTNRRHRPYTQKQACERRQVQLEEESLAYQQELMNQQEYWKQQRADVSASPKGGKKHEHRDTLNRKQKHVSSGYDKEDEKLEEDVEVTRTRRRRQKGQDSEEP